MIAPVATMLDPPDNTLRRLRERMGLNAALLGYLRPDLVRLLQFDDKKKERMTALPVRMYFGHIKNGRRNPADVCILLHTSEDRSRSPEQRFNLFSRHGNLEGSIKVNDAIQSTTYASAFRCIQEGSGINMDKLRAVIRYYFMAKGIKLPAVWALDAQFVDNLLAACRLARAQAILQDHINVVEVDRRVSKTNARDPGLFAEARTSPSRSGHASIIDAPTCTPAATPKILDVRVPSDASAMNREALRHSHQGRESHVSTLSDRLYGNNANRSLQISEALPASPSANYGLSPKPTMNDPRTPASNEFATDVSRSESIDTVQTRQPVGHPFGQQKSADSQSQVPLGHDAETFVSSYRRMLADSDALTKHLNTNKNQQDELADQIHNLQEQVHKLKEEEKKINIEQRQFRVEKKRLRQSLPARDRMMLEFGRELAARKSLNMDGGSYNSGSESEG